MASIGQLELWHSKAKTRVEKYKALLEEETRKKKEFGRPKTPQQTKAKENMVQKITRYRDEMEFSKRKEKEWDKQLKEARKEEKKLAPKSAKAVGKALGRKFNKSTAAKTAKTSTSKAASKSVKAKDNRIVLPSANGPADIEKVFSLLQDVMGKMHGLEQRLKSMEERANRFYKEN